ncbi:putative Kinase-like domain-containing protein [Seiridium cardinale]
MPPSLHSKDSRASSTEHKSSKIPVFNSSTYKFVQPAQNGTDPETKASQSKAKGKEVLRSNYKPLAGGDDAPDVEDVEEYRPGGFYPLDIGDELLGTFEIVHKLGHGRHATVWLGWHFIKQEWKAIKIFKARCSDSVMDVYKRLEDSTAKLGEDDATYIQLPEDLSWVESANGRHLCFTLPLLGPRITHHDRASFVFRKTLLLQAAEALRFLHGRVHVHGGVRPDNILMRLESANGINREDMVAKLGTVSTYKVEPQEPGDEFAKLHAPEFLVAPTTQLGHLKQKGEVAVVDAGVALSINDKLSRGTSSIVRYTAPEVYSGGEVTTGSDVWSFVLTILRLYFRDSDLFAKLPDSNLMRGKSYRDELLYLTDSLPETSESARASTIDGRKPLDLHQQIQRKLRAMNKSSDGVEISTPEVDLDLLADLLVKTLFCDTGRRPTIKDVIKHGFFTPPGAPNSTDAISTDKEQGKNTLATEVAKPSDNSSGLQALGTPTGDQGSLENPPTLSSSTIPPKTGNLIFLGFTAATAVWIVVFAVFLLTARTSAPGSADQSPCAPGFVYAQTRKLSAQTTFFEGIMAFPEHAGTLEDGTACPVFEDLRMESEVKAVTE